MKTLDEVLKSYELSCGKKDCAQCPYNNECLDHFVCECYERMDATLHYLKEYRDLQYGYIKAMADLEDNPPLTWDELKGMEGKPVWIEEIGQRYSSSHWMIHDGIADAYDGDEILYLQPFETKTKYSLGKTWQAYRKERK